MPNVITQFSRSFRSSEVYIERRQLKYNFYLNSELKKRAHTIYNIRFKARNELSRIRVKYKVAAFDNDANTAFTLI